MSVFELNLRDMSEAKINNPWASSRIPLPNIELAVCASISPCLRIYSLFYLVSFLFAVSVLSAKNGFTDFLMRFPNNCRIFGPHQTSIQILLLPAFYN